MDELGDASTTEIHRPHEQGSVPKVGQFLWHLLQMVLAMAAGMAIYVALFRLILTPDGYKAMQTEQPFLWYFETAPFMAVPMVALMRYHGYRWRQCTEMSAAMLIPPAGLIALVQVHDSVPPVVLDAHVARVDPYRDAIGHARCDALPPCCDSRHHRSC